MPLGASGTLDSIQAAVIAGDILGPIYVSGAMAVGMGESVTATAVSAISMMVNGYCRGDLVNHPICV